MAEPGGFTPSYPYRELPPRGHPPQRLVEVRVGGAHGYAYVEAAEHARILAAPRAPSATAGPCCGRLLCSTHARSRVQRRRRHDPYQDAGRPPGVHPRGRSLAVRFGRYRAGFRRNAPFAYDGALPFVMFTAMRRDWA
jgi:hypothetical protein